MKSGKWRRKKMSLESSQRNGLIGTYVWKDGQMIRICHDVSQHWLSSLIVTVISFVSGEDWLENYQEKWAATFLWSPGGIFAVPFQRYLFLMFKRTHYSFNLPNVDVNTDYCCIWCRLWDLLLQSAWSLLRGRAGSLLLRRGNHPHPPAHGPL